MDECKNGGADEQPNEHMINQGNEETNERMNEEMNGTVREWRND